MLRRNSEANQKGKVWAKREGLEDKPHSGGKFLDSLKDSDVGPKNGQDW